MQICSIDKFQRVKIEMMFRRIWKKNRRPKAIGLNKKLALKLELEKRELKMKLKKRNLRESLPSLSLNHLRFPLETKNPPN